MTDSAAKIALITGATGFIGSLLCRALLEQNYTLWILSRRAPSKTAAANHPKVHCFASLEALPDTANPHVIINLAGEPIADKRWSDERKKLLLDSRVGVTQQLVNVFKERKAPEVVISGSAIGYYGANGDAELTETCAATPSFSHTLCSAWEEAAQAFVAMGSRVCVLRTGVVLDSNGGTLKRLEPLFRLGLGGPIGSGKQWMSWIHREDLVRLIIFLIENDHLNGPVNGTAPNPATNAEFARALGRALHRPAFMPTPALALKLVFGQMAEELLLSGQRVLPEKALQAGFSFNYETLPAALNKIYQK